MLVLIFHVIAMFALLIAGNLNLEVWSGLRWLDSNYVTSPEQRYEQYMLTRSGFVVESSALLNYFTPVYVYCDRVKAWVCASDFHPKP
jgi:hypothetical protein